MTLAGASQQLRGSVKVLYMGILHAAVAWKSRRLRCSMEIFEISPSSSVCKNSLEIKYSDNKCLLDYFLMSTVGLFSW